MADLADGPKTKGSDHLIDKMNEQKDGTEMQLLESITNTHSFHQRGTLDIICKCGHSNIVIDDACCFSDKKKRMMI